MSNFFKNWPKPPSSPPGGEIKWPEVPKQTIEREIGAYASIHTQPGFLQLFYDFMIKTKTFIFMNGVRDKINPPSQAALTRLNEIIESMHRKPTNEGRIAVLFEALAYLKANYARLFPQNRLIGEFNAKTGKLGPSRIVDPDEYFIAKWGKIVEGGDYARNASNAEKTMAKLKYTGGKTRKNTRKMHRRRKATRRRA